MTSTNITTFIGTVYKYIFNDGTIYIGSSKNYIKRMREHNSRPVGGVKRKLEAGYKVIGCEIIVEKEVTSMKELHILEQQYINEYQPTVNIKASNRPTNTQRIKHKSENTTGIIYKMEMTNDEFYIGSTKRDLNTRRGEHMTKSSGHIRTALDSGVMIRNIEAIETISSSDDQIRKEFETRLLELEQKYINELKPSLNKVAAISTRTTVSDDISICRVCESINDQLDEPQELHRYKAKRTLLSHIRNKHPEEQEYINNVIKYKNSETIRD